MSFIPLKFFVFLLILLVLYYIVPRKIRWFVLLSGSICFYYISSPKGLVALLLHILLGYLFGRIISGCDGKGSKLMLIVTIVVDILPLVALKYFKCGNNLVIPVGISFYTLQTIAYHVDLYREKVDVQKNILKYCLFISFFSQILQGPIPRYAQLKKSLFEENCFSEQKVTHGFRCILWGCFLKLIIADKAAVFVNTIFDNYTSYQGLYIFLAGCLYSIQLYADFLACTKLAQGIALLFGVTLEDNFYHPYFATSVKDFWRRWHISLSSWLRDYIYIPLGGNRRGTLYKYRNLLITFFVSGLWHGVGIKFIFWGMLHGVYQMIGEFSFGIRKRISELLELNRYPNINKFLNKVGTFFLVMIAWIIFRADSLYSGLRMIKSMCSVFNIWILFDKSLWNLGLSLEEIGVLLLGIVILYKVSGKQEIENTSDFLDKYPLVIRWSIYIGLLLGILIFGTYGMGYAVSDFIYEGF